MTTSPLALIIEDDIDLGTIFAKAIKAAGLDTQIIPDGKQAAERRTELTPFATSSRPTMGATRRCALEPGRVPQLRNAKAERGQQAFARQ